MSHSLQSHLLTIIKSEVKEKFGFTEVKQRNSALRRVVCSESATGQRCFRLVLCSSKDFFWDTTCGLGWPAQRSSFTPPSKLQKLQTSWFHPLAFLSSVPHLHVILLSFEGYVWHGWWLSGKLLKHCSDGGGGFLKILSDFDSECVQRSCMPLGLPSCQNVSRAGVLAKNQAATMSLDSCFKCGFVCSLLLEEVFYRKHFSWNVGAYCFDSLLQHRRVFRGDTCVTDKEHFSPWKGGMN